MTRAAPAIAPSRRGFDHTAERHQATALQPHWRVGADLRLRQLLHADEVPKQDGDHEPAAINSLREVPQTHAVIT